MGRKNVKVEWKYIPENVFQDDFWQWFLSPREVHKFSRRWVTLCAGKQTFFYILTRKYFSPRTVIYIRLYGFTLLTIFFLIA